MKYYIFQINERFPDGEDARYQAIVSFNDHTSEKVKNGIIHDYMLDWRGNADDTDIMQDNWYINEQLTWRRFNMVEIPEIDYIVLKNYIPVV